jgi:hypothetical protein
MKCQFPLLFPGRLLFLLAVISSLLSAAPDRDFRKIYPSFCFLLVDVVQVPAPLEAFENRVEIASGVYVPHPDLISGVSESELKSSKRYLFWLKGVGQKAKILLVPKIGWHVPGFDGVLYSETGTPLANLSLTHVPGGAYRSEPDTAVRVFRSHRRKAISFSHLDAWIRKNAVTNVLVKDEEGSGFSLDPSFVLRFGTLAFNSKVGPSQEKIWAHIQFVRLASRIFGVPYSVTKRPTHIVIDLTESEFTDGDLLQNAYAQIQEIARDSGPIISRVVVLNGETVTAFQSSGLGE